MTKYLEHDQVISRGGMASFKTWRATSILAGSFILFFFFFFSSTSTSMISFPSFSTHHPYFQDLPRYLEESGAILQYCGQPHMETVKQLNQSILRVLSETRRPGNIFQHYIENIHGHHFPCTCTHIVFGFSLLISFHPTFPPLPPLFFAIFGTYALILISCHLLCLHTHISRLDFC